jgi:ion channel-forming bestrophin family protein
MHTGKSYSVSQFLYWTRRNIFWSVVIAFSAVVLHQVFHVRWIAIPWTVVGLLGTAAAFIVGFKNLQTYNRTWEARQIWGSVVSNSRAWGIMCRDFLSDPDKSKDLVYRHFAWLTALRYQIRESREWETNTKKYNEEYKRFYSIPERETPLEKELEKYISADEVKLILGTKNKAAQLLSLQGKMVKKLYDKAYIDTLQFLDMHKALRDFFEYQGKSERIKNFPYPRQYATISIFFVRLFCFLLPFGMLGEFNKLNQGTTGILDGWMVWLVIPFSVIISWVYTSLEQVGESSENPFEGSANDVPVSQMSRALEIDVREMLGETDLPPALRPENNIVL